MRAQKRRMPAERAHHAKRLGHVQQGSGPAFPVVAPAAKAATSSTSPPKATATTSTQQDTTTLPTQITLPTSTPEQQSSTLSPPSSTPSSSASTLSTTPLTSSVVAPSINGQSTAATMSISSSTYQSSTIPTLVTSTTPSSSATSTPFTTVAAAKSNGLSGGAIAGIVAGAIVVGVALIVLFVRKTALRRRERQRISWSAAPGVAGIFPEPKLPDSNEKPTASDLRGGSPVSPFEPYGQSVYSTPPPPVVRVQTSNIPTYAPLAPPPTTFNNLGQVGPYPPPSVPPAFASGNTAMAYAAAATPVSAAVPPVRGPRVPVETTVKCAFVPSLPDELSITTGERIHVIARYDDGWALCGNARGEQGMVPQECLDIPSSANWQDGRRLSSLNADGRQC